MGMLAACSADETVEDNPGLEISFAPSINKVTRAADVTSANLPSYGFNVTAMKQVAGGSETTYFSGVDYKWNGNAYGSVDKYYWPATDKLNFYAYAMATDAASQVTKIDYKSFKVEPDADWNKQVDLVFASTKDKVKADSENGVVLNFRHTGAKIKVKVKNTSKTLRFDVTGWKVGFLSPTATFTFDGTATDDDHTSATTATHTLSMDSWSNHAGRSLGTEYVSEFTLPQIPAYDGTDNHEQYLAGEMILLPQETPALTAYANATVGADVTNPYIALKMVIRNNDADGTVVASAGGDTPVWATWPLPTTKWEPGKVYTYLVDLSGGGYYPNNQDSDPDLDPLLTEVKFVSVTVDDWNDGGTHDVKD
jgi:hypothetical protein